MCNTVIFMSICRLVKKTLADINNFYLSRKAYFKSLLGDWSISYCIKENFSAFTLFWLFLWCYSVSMKSASCSSAVKTTKHCLCFFFNTALRIYSLLLYSSFFWSFLVLFPFKISLSKAELVFAAGWQTAMVFCSDTYLSISSCLQTFYFS